MTQKDKAIELFDKYCIALAYEKRDDGYFTNVLHAKQCALIAVDEILWEIIKYSDNSQQYVIENTKFWQQVKEELQKL